MSQQQLDYAGSTDAGSSIRARLVIGIALVLAATAFAPAAFWLANAALGMGGGTVVPMLSLYPLPLWIAWLSGLGPQGLVRWLMLSQFPAYGVMLAIGIFGGMKRFLIVFVGLAVVHLGSLGLLVLVWR